MNRPIIAAAFVLPLAACQGGSASAVDTRAELAAISETERAQMAALAHDDLDGFMAAYAPDAVFTANSAPIDTPEGIRAVAERMIADPSMDLRFIPGRTEIAASGDLAYTSASYLLTTTDRASGEPRETAGTVLVVWAKQPDGSWKIVADHGATAPVNEITALAEAAPPNPGNGMMRWPVRQ